MKIEITLAMSNQNGSTWAVYEVSKNGRSGPHYTFAELEKQLPAIQGVIDLKEPAVARDYLKLKALVDEHNKQNSIPDGT